MSDLLDRISAAQRDAGERVVMDDLRRKGLLEPLAGPDLLTALKLAAGELERYVQLQTMLDYIEYAASTQKVLDEVNAAIAGAEKR